MWHPCRTWKHCGIPQENPEMDNTSTSMMQNGDSNKGHPEQKKSIIDVRVRALRPMHHAGTLDPL